MLCKLIQKLFIEREEGFTLLEVMVSLVILSIGLLGLAALQLVAVKSNAFSSEMTYATMLAQQHAEVLKSLPFTDSKLDPNGNPHTTIGSSKGVQYTVTWNVTDDSPDTDMKTVTLAVQWTSQRQGSASEAATVTARLRTILRSS